jgi:hypothetical protein
VEPPNLRDLWLLGAALSADPRRGLLPLPHRGARVDRVAPAGATIAEVAAMAKAAGVAWISASETELRPQHRLQHRPLFERLPELGDIHQHQMGDCWFLAALAAIAHAGTGHAIELMMREVDEVGADAFAYVRLWDQALRPRYVQVETSLIEVEGGPSSTPRAGCGRPCWRRP